MENKIFFLLTLIGIIILFLGIIIALILLLMERKADWSDYDSYILSLFWGPGVCFNAEQNKEKCLEHMENKLKYYKTGGDMSIEVDFSGISVHPSWYLEKVDFHFYEFEVNKTTIVDIAPIIIPSLLKVLEKNDWD